VSRVLQALRVAPLLVGAFTLFYWQSAFSASHATQGLAYQACMANAQTMDYNSNWNGLYQCTNMGTWYKCTFGGASGTSYLCNITGTSWPAGTECSNEPGGTGFFNTSEPPSWCQDGCEYEATTGTCNQEHTQCQFNVEPSGNTCTSGGPGPDDPPQNCTLDAFGYPICDCSVTPDDPWCTSPPGDPNVPEGCTLVGDVVTCTDTTNPPDNNTNPDNNQDSTGTDGNTDGSNSNNTTDGDPDTSDSPGSGDGDTDGDGNRDIDCDPSSNPDCGYTGSASWSSQCGSPPYCTGEPEQCATLMQVYNVMCANLQVGNQVTNAVKEVSAELKKTIDFTPPTGIDEAVQEATDQETAITDGTSSYWLLTDDEKGQFIADRESEMVGLLTGLWSPLVGVQCSNIVVSTTKGDFTITVEKFAPAIRAALNFLMWVGVAFAGWFLFLRWGT
jgi:hypothetical protein